MPALTFGSVCSGIEAASVAWHQLGWRAEWLAEIEAYPCFVLHHHYGSGRPLNMPDPGAPGLSQEDRDARAAAIKAVSKLPLVTTGPRNLGDMTRIEKMVRDGTVSAPDVLVGGTPCQAFSIAGLRGGLDDARGQLTIAYFKLANEIDATRAFQGKPPAIIVWENVPGVLSDKSNAFGCFLAGLAGEDCELEPPRDSKGRRKSWPNAGCVFGPQRTIAWRVIDAQYTGVAQRRRRVFVVASAREDFDPTAVLFEFDGLRRDTAPSREAWEDTARDALSGAVSGSDVDALPTATDSGVICMAHGQGGAEVPAPSTFAIQNATRGAAQNGLGISNGPMYTLDVGSQHGVAFSIALRGRDGGATAEMGGDVAGTLRAGGGGGDKAHVLAPAFAIQAGALRTNPNSGPDGVGVQEHIAYTLEARAEVQAIAFDSRQDPVSSSSVFGALGSSSPQAQAVCSLAFAQNTRDEVRLMGGDGEISVALAAQPGMKQTTYVAPGGMAVRRLTPRECERLQGFPDDYTLIPGMRSSVKSDELEEWVTYLRENYPMITREEAKVMAADGPRYKALGNSMAVPCMLFIGTRIQQHLQLAA